jgi:hypothetical protein
MITCADQAAPKPAHAASVPLNRERPAARKPSTVAGGTNGPAAALASTPTTLTWPEMAATTGRVARCAASGTASDSAKTLGIHRLSRTVHPGAQPMMPALASTDNVKPTERLRNGSIMIKITVARQRLRRPARRPPEPRAARATNPIAAARRTLGSVRQSPTKITTPATPTSRRAQPRIPTQRAVINKKASSRVRLAPDTAVR